MHHQDKHSDSSRKSSSQLSHNQAHNKQVTAQTLKAQTIKSHKMLSEIMIESNEINVQLDQMMEGVKSSYSKIQTIDQELQSQLQIIRMLVVQLENKKLDVQIVYDRVLVQTEATQKLQIVLQKLQETSINPTLLKESEVQEQENNSVEAFAELNQQKLSNPLGENSNLSNARTGPGQDYESQSNLNQEQQQLTIHQEKPNKYRNSSDTDSKSPRTQLEQKMQEIQMSSSLDQIDLVEEDEQNEVKKIKNLFGFVDEDSIENITSRAEQRFLQLQEIKRRALNSTESVIKLVSFQINKIHKSKSDLDIQNSEMNKKYQQIKYIMAELLKISMSVENIYNQVDTIQLKLQADNLEKLYKAVTAIHSEARRFHKEMSQAFEIFKSQSDVYDDFYEVSRESYVSFVNFAPQVQKLMVEVEEWHSTYEQSRLSCSEEYEEIEKLTTWYEYFLEAYQALEIELQRRKKYEENIKDKVTQFQSFLDQSLEAELRTRVQFNDKYQRYLPGNLKHNIAHPPTRFQLYPKIFVEKIKKQEQISLSAPTFINQIDEFFEQLRHYQQETNMAENEGNQ